MFEIITSEYSYMHSLNILVCHFMRSEELKETMTQMEHHHLFSNISDILAVSTRQVGPAWEPLRGCRGCGVLQLGRIGSDGAGMRLPRELKRRRDVVWERRKPREPCPPFPVSAGSHAGDVGVPAAQS